MQRELLCGVVDSGFSPAQANRVAAARRFWLDESRELCEGQIVPDANGHGTAVLAAMGESAPATRFCVAQVFDQRGVTSGAQIAAAVHWLVAQGVRVINLSLGVRSSHDSMAQACQEATAAGILLCASSPAQGAPVFPAAYPGVLRMTGDARCAFGQWSWLDSAQADFGTSVRLRQGAMAGASMGTAMMTGIILDYLQAHPGASNAMVVRHLQDHATFTGVERKGMP
ncbi:S8 family peptidase [Brachymonas denitrificans]|uniref:subtilisin-like serine protease QhpE n=1 Tax=Brachymonas denitrificans TaxID=28220 RepID=UPI002AFEBBB7|nr:S8 family serine peptidase [Brachymonas denitrificans]